MFIPCYCSVPLCKTSTRQHFVWSGMRWRGVQARGMSAGFDVELEQQAREHLKYILHDHHGNAEKKIRLMTHKKCSPFKVWFDFFFFTQRRSAPDTKVRGSFSGSFYLPKKFLQLIFCLLNKALVSYLVILNLICFLVFTCLV